MPDSDDAFEELDPEDAADDRPGWDDLDDESDDEVEDEDSEGLDDLDDLDPEDAQPDEIDFVIAAYREAGQLTVLELNADLANDLEELITQLRRLPGDAGALGFVSLVEEVAVLVRVRGRHVQVLLNDAAAALDWPIARDVLDQVGGEVPDPEDDPEVIGDLGMLADLGVSEFDLASLVEDLDLPADQVLGRIADRVGIGTEFRRIAEAALHP